jgi:hypothetical protein
MSPDVAELVAPLIALLGVGSFVLIAMKLRYNHLRETKHGLGREELDRLAQAVELLHDDMRVMRDDIVDLSERVDFAERVLARGRSEGAAPGALPEPREP